MAFGLNCTVISSASCMTKVGQPAQLMLIVINIVNKLFHVEQFSHPNSKLFHVEQFAPANPVLHRFFRCRGLSSCSTLRLDSPQDAMARVIAVANQKGGV